MKLETIEIENFRGIQHLKLDFQDELERVQEVVPIVGPNTSGKTTILDAITCCLAPGTELWTMRPDLVYSPASLVRHGAAHARITCTVRFSDVEIACTQKILELTESPDAAKVPSANRVTVHWQYPDPADRHLRGVNQYEPSYAYLLFKGRKRAIGHFHVPRVSARSLQDLGGIFMFDQKRTGLGQRRTHSQLDARRNTPGAHAGAGADDFIHDPRQILLTLATRAQAPQTPQATERGDFDRLRELYARVCKPHRIKDLINTASGLDLEFEGPQGTYFFDGLSSGQVMLLLLLLQFAKNRIHQSIVLIDELELHLHPLWQSRLHQSLGELGVGNQVFFTTHSTHLRDLLRGAVFHSTGDLGDDAVKKVEV